MFRAVICSARGAVAMLGQPVLAAMKVAPSLVAPTLIAAASLAPAMLACEGTEGTTDADGGSGGTGGDGSGGGDLGSFVAPTTFTARGGFAYDPQRGTTRAYYPDASSPVPLNPWLELVVTQQAADGREAFTCVVNMFTNQSEFPGASWKGTRFGVDLSGSPHQSSCYGWDPALWLRPEEVMDRWSWGLSVGTLRAELLDGPASLRASMPELGPRAWQEHWGPFLVGGGLFWSRLAEADAGAWPGGIDDWGYALGYEVNDDFVVQYETLDPPVESKHLGAGIARQIPRAVIEAGDGLPRGLFIVTLTRPLSADLLFARP